LGQNLKPEAYQELVNDSFIGERAVYAVKWDPPWYLFFLPKMDAGEMELHLTGMAEFNNRPVLKTVLTIRSSGILARLTGFVVDDEFLIYSQPETLRFAGASIRIREGKKKRQRIMEYLPDLRRLLYREIDEAATLPKIKKDVVREDVPNSIWDPISAFYLYRSEKLLLDHSRTYLIVNNDKMKQSSARVEKQEAIKSPAGKFLAWRIWTDVMEGDLFRQKGQLRVWVSADEKQIPLQFEAKVGMGKVFGTLKSFTP
jgi:hypothetical protein